MHPVLHSKKNPALRDAARMLRRYGLVYPGVGWVIFRSKDYLPESLVFHDNYL